MSITIEAPGFLEKFWPRGDNVNKVNNDNPPQNFGSVLVIGAAGQTGEFYTRNLASVIHTEAVVKTRRWKDETDHSEIKFYTSIEEALKAGSEAVILATPNSPDTDKILEEIAKYAQKPLTLILPQNGIGVGENAERILAISKSSISLVRACLCTTVGRDDKGDIDYNQKKMRIVLASVGEDEGSLQKAENMFTRAGFNVKVRPDHHSMEWSKLMLNLIGSTSTITGLAPLDAFSDPEIFDREHLALNDRLRILKAADIELDDELWGIGKLKRLAWFPGFVYSPSIVRGFVAKMFAKERNNQLPAAARQINEGAKTVESCKQYHQPFVDLGKEHGLESPVDETIMEILKRHSRNNNFSLKLLKPEERKELLFEIFGYESKNLFIKGRRHVRWFVERLVHHYLDYFCISGGENLIPAAVTLRNGKSAIVSPRHQGHPDHPLAVEATYRSLYKEDRKYPVIIVAGMKFDQEQLSGKVNDSFPHVVVCTLSEGAGEKEKWVAGLINKRSKRVIDRLLKKPSIFIIYPEGGRSKVVNKKGQSLLQKAAIGCSSWFLDTRFGSITPVVISGTEKMLFPGEQWPHHAGVDLKFLRTIKTSWLRREAAKIHDRIQRDRFVSDFVMKRIAAEVPRGARGPYEEEDLDLPVVA